METSYQKARATRIWQDSLGNELESPTRFLWEDVARLEGPEGLRRDPEDGGELIRWQNTAPKTLIFFHSGATVCVLGKLEKWDERWDLYLHQLRRDSALIRLN